MARDKRKKKGASDKISVGQLVAAGLLRPGALVLCNNWGFAATVTETGAFQAQWTRGAEEDSRTEFDTPSAWATAVCRVVRGQARAATATTSGGGGRVASSGGPGESRVAVNGWTACRVVVAADDPQRRLAERLAGDSSGAIEVPLDALRREYAAMQRGGGAGSDDSGDEMRALSGAVHGLALSSRPPAPRNSRKRKGGAAGSARRQAKLSRVPSVDSNDETRTCLDAFRAAVTCSRNKAELRALRQRRRSASRCAECQAPYGADPMVCCDVCTAWVHAACDPALAPAVHDALVAETDAPYACPACMRPPVDEALQGVVPLLSDPETVSDSEEAARLLLSFTHSDVRFPAAASATDSFARINSLVVLDWGRVSGAAPPAALSTAHSSLNSSWLIPPDGFHVLRLFTYADQPHTAAMQTYIDEPARTRWRGWLKPGSIDPCDAAAITEYTASSDSLSGLLSFLFAQQADPPAATNSLFASAAVAHPLNFLDLHCYSPSALHELTAPN
ncbi:hypothetical protein GGI04_003783, partial [Coemansia thaxteri]